MNLENLVQSLKDALGARAVSLAERLGEVTVEVAPGDLREVAHRLRDHEGLRFEQLIDLCGVDYAAHGKRGEDEEGGWSGRRFAVVIHLLSVSHNRRVRLRAFCADDAFPLMPSVLDIWPVANWFEREAFDLFGIVFEGHPDLRRILTDYGFVGHPFRKDFPLSGNVEVRYDPEAGRVIYQPVTVEPRIVTPRTVREENYGG
jgi:NADH-quinone oxidoreductase subunit C